MKTIITMLFALMLLATATFAQSTSLSGAQPWGIVFDGTNIWAADYGKITIVNNQSIWAPGNTVTAIQASTGTIVRTVTVGTSPYGVVYDGANVWVSNAGSASVTKIQTSTGTVLGTFAVGKTPSGIVFDGTANIWVVNYYDGTVTELLASSGAVVGTYNVGFGLLGPIGAVWDGANVWITDGGDGYGNSVAKLSGTTGAVLGTFSVGTNARSAVYDGANVWVANFESGNVTKLRASDGAVLGTFSVGGSAEGIAFDGTSIWSTVSTGSSTNLVNLRISDGAILSTTAVGTFSCPVPSPAPPTPSPFASGLAYDGAHFWVSFTSGCSVSKL